MNDGNNLMLRVNKSVLKSLAVNKFEIQTTDIVK